MGVVASGFTYSHEVFGEGFYMVDVLVKRLSNSNDRIPLMISERLIDVTQDYTVEALSWLSGQFRSYNRHEEQKNRLVLSVFVREVEFIDEELDGAKTNHILLEGYICKKAGVQENTAWKRNCGPASGGEPSVWKIRLYSMYLLGKKCTVCIRILKWESMFRYWEESRAGVCKKII